MKKRILFTIAVLLGIILFVFGVPIVINECYKTGGYVTLWSAEDVLSYYGTILGATVSVVVLAATILFTRKQIRHDQFVNTQSEKWKSVDAIINQAIEAVQPLHVAQMVYADVGYEHAGETINKLQRHIMNMKKSLDMLNCHLDSDEGKRLSALIQQILSCMEEVESLASQMVQQLSCIQRNKLHENYKELLRLALQSPDTVDEETVQNYQNYLKANPYTPPDRITEEIGDIGLKLVGTYNTTYQSLLDKKREVFRDIERENMEKADEILKWFSGKER